MRLILSIAAGVVLGVVGVFAIYALAAWFIGRFFPIVSGRARIASILRKSDVPDRHFDRATLTAAAEHAWALADMQTAVRGSIMQQFYYETAMVAHVLAADYHGIGDERDDLKTIAAIIHQRAARKRRETKVGHGGGER